MSILRSKPRLSYCGLTVVLSNPSRFDKLRLLSANGGQMFNNYCLRPEFNEMQTDVRLMEDNSPLLPDTKCILLLGEKSMWKYLPETTLNTLNEMRGSLMYHKGIPCISSYLPQDATDYKSYEAQLNPLAQNYSTDDSLSDGDEENEGDVKALGKTKRANYSFWLKRDVWKCKQILDAKTTTISNSYTRNLSRQKPSYNVYPPSEEVIKILTQTKGRLLYFDIETDYEEQNLQCFAFSFGLDIYSVPVLDYNYRCAYGTVHRILRALAVAIRDNTVVAHNGATFDFFVLANKYGIVINKCYDTLIAMHRCFPDIEKSLGHCVSYWTWEKFHKDEDSRGYFTQQQMMDRLKYCGKDVYTMMLVKEAIDTYAKTIPGLTQSINDAMLCIKPYLISTLQGIKVDQDMVVKMCNENDRLMMQYNRMTELLIGEQGLRDCRSSIRGKASLFAGSNKQCCEYFHTLLGYPVVMRSSKTQQPSLGKKALYKLALKHDNPVITLICAYRTVAKETSRLRFIPWESQHEANKKSTNSKEEQIRIS